MQTESCEPLPGLSEEEEARVVRMTERERDLGYQSVAPKSLSQFLLLSRSSICGHRNL